MPVRFTLQDGTPVEADTPEEALRLLQLVSTRSAEPPHNAVLSWEGLPMNARRFLEILAAHPDGISGSEVAKGIGIEPKGLGPVVLSVLKWGKKSGFSRRDILVKARKREGGVVMRQLKLGTPLLRRLRQEGLVRVERVRE